MEDENSELLDMKDKIVKNTQIFLKSLKDQVKNRWSGKRILLCGSGRKGGCNERCADSTLNEKCGYHKRLSIQDQLFSNQKIECVVLDELELNDPPGNLLEKEENIIRELNIDAIVILLDPLGPHLEFEHFRKKPELVNKMLVFIEDEHYPFYSIEEGILTDEIKQYIFKDRGHRFIVNSNKDIYKLVEEIILLYFMNS